MQETKPKIDINKKYKTRDGRPVRIICTDRRSEGCKYPVIALITFSNNNEVCSTYNEVGEYSSEDHDLDLIEVQPWEDFKIDDPVLVSNGGVNWYKGHFAGISVSGFPMIFNGHRSSFTAEHKTDVTAWVFCKKPEPEPVKVIDTTVLVSNDGMFWKKMQLQDVRKEDWKYIK